MEAEIALAGSFVVFEISAVRMPSQFKAMASTITCCPGWQVIHLVFVKRRHLVQKPLQIFKNTGAVVRDEFIQQNNGSRMPPVRRRIASILPF